MHDPDCALTLAPERFSPVTGNSSDSIHTSLHTSLNLREWPRGPRSLCALWMENPPLALQVHFDGNFFVAQPYLSARDSWKAYLCKAKPWAGVRGAGLLP